MLHINTLSGHERMSTRELLQKIATAVETGETEFQIAASGQHDIGATLWSREGKEVSLRVWNPGQRVGGMCLKGTRVVVEGSAPADAGWLNSGGEIVIKGDAGDTAGHCAASGCIYIGGRAGARSGSLMKHDPLYGAPELWILKSTGSFSFEFMGGGAAIICGHESMALPSVLGDRPGVGMVGGVIYFRGKCPQLPADVVMDQLNENDMQFLDKGLERFLQALGRPELKRDLTIWKHWRKLIPAPGAHTPEVESVSTFRQCQWVKNGIFRDILEDDLMVAPLVPKDADRLRFPVWQYPDACVDCRFCLLYCPQSAIKRRQVGEKAFYSSRAIQCTGCGICAGVCPSKVWQMNINKQE